MPGSRGHRLRVNQRPKILGQLLVDDGVLTAADLEKALHEQRVRGGRLGEVLVRSGLATEDVVARTLARQLGLPFEAPPLLPAPDAPRRITEALARSRLHGRRRYRAPGPLHDSHAALGRFRRSSPIYWLFRLRLADFKDPFRQVSPGPGTHSGHSGGEGPRGSLAS